jgi:16S rRNA (guanine527-N7)-methyltransferase
MDKGKFTALLGQASQEIGVSLTEPQRELFRLYLQELLEWNQKFNLTGIKDPGDIIIKHFVDSLTPLPYLEVDCRLLDIGPGAGFPGIPLKIAASQLHVTLVDASRRKVSFLKHLIRILELQKISAQHGRVEEMERPDNPFQIIISRAFQRFELLLKIVSPILEPKNMLVAMLGPTTRKELSGFEDLASLESLVLSRAVSLELPLGRGQRTLLFFQKR